jgi:uncharacterized membrane protein
VICLIALFWLPPKFEKAAGAVTVVLSIGYVIASFNEIGDQIHSAPGGSYLSALFSGIIGLLVLWAITATRWVLFLCVSIIALTVTRERQLRASQQTGEANHEGKARRKSRYAIRAGFVPLPRKAYSTLYVIGSVYVGGVFVELALLKFAYNQLY